MFLSVGRVGAVSDMPTHMRGKGCTDASSPGSPFVCLGVGCLWQAESWWGLRGSCCGELGKEGGALLLLSKTLRSVVKEESIPSIKRSLSLLPGGQSD